MVGGGVYRVRDAEVRHRCESEQQEGPVAARCADAARPCERASADGDGRRLDGVRAGRGGLESRAEATEQPRRARRPALRRTEAVGHLLGPPAPWRGRHAPYCARAVGARRRRAAEPREHSPQPLGGARRTHISQPHLVMVMGRAVGDGRQAAGAIDRDAWSRGGAGGSGSAWMRSP